MKRAVVLVLIVFIFGVGYFSVWGRMPFAPVFDSGMRPDLQTGSLLFIKPVGPVGVKAGDTVIYNVPVSTRETYNYPPLVARRVIEIKTDQSGTWLRTGDNAGADPSLVRQGDIRGTSAGQFAYIGLPLLIFQSGAGTACIAVIIVLFALYLYSSEINLFIQRRFRTFVSPIVEENHRVSLVLSNRFEHTEKALEGFSNAMQLYGQHLASHTSAIQGLAEASQSLKGSAAEQNRILSQMTEVYTQQRSKEEVSRIQGVVDDFERRTREALEARDALEQVIIVEKRHAPAEPRPAPVEPPAIMEPHGIAAPPAIVKVRSPQGCAVKPKALLARPHYYSN